jgi:CO/xanthine dehydrogenase Mo-binding subunit
VHDSFRAAKTKDLVVVDTGDVTAALKRGAHSASGTYLGPYQSHGTMAPNCAVADVTQDGAVVMCADQGIYQTRNGIAQVTGLPLDKIRVQYYAGSNTYGSSCYQEAAVAAAVLSQEVGKPVRMQFARHDEFGWDNYGPALHAEIRGAVDANGKIVAFEYQGWGHYGGGFGLNAAQHWRLEAPRLRLRLPEAAVAVAAATALEARSAASTPCTCHKTKCMTSRTGGWSIIPSRVRDFSESGHFDRRWIPHISSRRKG